MQVYFSKVPEDMQYAGMLDEVFVADDIPYFYCVEILDIDTVLIKDSCNRLVPFNVEDIPALVCALQFMYGTVGDKIKNLNRIKDELKELEIAA